MITRVLEESIRNKLGQDKAIVIMGARQVGKTTLLKHLFKEKKVYCGSMETNRILVHFLKTSQQRV